jgi:hypothetical protein
MAVDSVAVFSERIMELELSNHVDRFVSAGWYTFAKLAHGSHAGQSGDEDAFKADILTRGLGDPNHKDAPSLRRLYYEAFYMSSQDLRLRLDAPDSTPRPMSAPERRERFAKLEKRLTGLNLRGPLEPSNALIDRCAEMFTQNAVFHLPLELCTKREMEVHQVKKDPFFATSVSPTGAMVLSKLRDELVSVPDCQYEMSFAFQRRAIALDIADVMKFETHELLHQRLVRSLMKEPLQGFARVSVDQLLAADMEAWSLLSEHTRMGVRRCGNLERPCDLAMPVVLAHTEFVMAIMPRQIPIRTSQPQQNAIADKLQGLTKKQKAAKRKAENEQLLAQKVAKTFIKPGPAKGTGKGSGKASGKAAGKAPREFVRLPAALVGMNPRSNKATSERRICFGFNLGTCSSCSPGQECSKGLHVCMKPNAAGEACSQPHAALKCTVC